jgi:hypothetical protein
MPYIATDIKTRLEQSKVQLAEFIRQRDQLNVAIIQIQNEIRALSAIVWRDELTQRHNDIELAVIGISDAVRSVLRLQNKAMTAAQVKDALDLMGYNFAGLANASALVHNTLKRMAGTGELEFTPDAKTFSFPRRTLTPGEAKRMMQELLPKPVQTLGTHKLPGKR